MALDFLRQGDCTFNGPALPEPYVRFELEKSLNKYELLPDTDGLAGQTLREQWDIFRRKLRDVSPNSGPVAITNRIIEPLVARLEYTRLAPAEDVLTREGEESGGALMSNDDGAKLRCWAIDYDADLDAPTQRGYAYRFSPIRIAQRVLLATGERVGLITNGVELRLLLCDPARPDSHIEIDLNVWRLSRDLPDGYQLLLALAGPKGVAALPEIVEDARLKQNKVTKELRVQARRAVEEFVQAVLDHPDNAAALPGHADKTALAKALWHEGLIVVYRLLFILKCESTSDPSRVFRFASTPLWRNTYSPSTALARMVRRVLDEGATSGRYLEDGLRVLFKLFADGLDHPGLTVRPLGGALFGAQSTPLHSSLRWGELAVAHLLNRLLWSDTRRGRERVHYGPLDVEDLGRVYEALLELEPGIAAEPMCRLRRQKLEVVVPAAQGEKYKAAGAAPSAMSSADTDENGNEDDDGDGSEDGAENDKPTRGKKTKVEWIGDIKPGRFYLRVGLGRKSSGSYYTPHSFVRFLVQETLGPQCDERSPRDNPNPGAILKLKVLDPACGSGHFLVEACRFLAGRLYEAARLCDELATKAEYDADGEKNAARKQGLFDRAAELRQRLKDLPDNEDELLSYLPSRSAGADKAVLSAHDIARAEAICRRLVAVHCIYGADLNPLAVELAKLSLWIESHAEGFPLTFLDHRIVVGNSLTGPFWDKLIFAPGSQQPVSDLFRQNLDLKFAAKLGEALSLVRQLDASVGVDVQDIAAKQQIKAELDARLQPFRILAAAWSGGVMLGTDQPDGAPRCDDEAYADLLRQVGTSGEVPATIDNLNLRAMIAKGHFALAYDLTFPEVFHPTGLPHGRQGFNVVIGNPPWDTIVVNDKEFGSNYDARFLDSRGRQTKSLLASLIESSPQAGQTYEELRLSVSGARRVKELLAYAHLSNREQIGHSDEYQIFACRKYHLVTENGRIGVVLPASFYSGEPASACRETLLLISTPWYVVGVSNVGRYFEIAPVAKFALVVTSRKATNLEHRFRARFQVVDFTDVIADRDWIGGVHYPVKLVAGATGHLRLVFEVSSNDVLSLLEDMYSAGGGTVGTALTSANVELVQEFNVTSGDECAEPITASVEQPKAWAFVTKMVASGLSVLAEAKTFYAFDWHYRGAPNSGWNPQPTKCVRWAEYKTLLAIRLPFFRLALRRTVGSVETNERSLVAAILPPGITVANSAVAESRPATRPNSAALSLTSILNSFSLDCVARMLVNANLNDFLLRSLPWPKSQQTATFLCHAALRLSSTAIEYEPLWREQLGDAWREPGKAPFTWPVLANDDERWAVRAGIDAVVADVYGLSREQYAHVLSTFSHASYKKAPDLCLAAFNELKSICLDDFCKKHDPYHDIPLVETLPKPVINLPIPDDPADADANNVGVKSPGRKRNRRGKRATHPVLWEETNGQLTLEPPGPIFDAPTSGTPAAAVPEPGKVLAVKTLLEMRKVLTSAEVQAEFSLEPAAARAILKHLTDTGAAIVEGKAKGTKYRLAKK